MQHKQNELNEKLLCAIQDRNPPEVFACLVDGAQADGKDENGHAFLVHADSRHEYDKSDVPTNPKEREKQRKTDPNDMYGILTNFSVNSKTPRTVEIAGFWFNVHDPSPSHGPDDLGGLQYLMDGDRQFIENNSRKIQIILTPPDWIDRDPTWFSIVLDFYHMGEHMPWKREVRTILLNMQKLHREAVFYHIPWLVTNTAKRVKNLQEKALASKFLSFLQTIFKLWSNSVELIMMGNDGYMLHDVHNVIKGYIFHTADARERIRLRDAERERNGEFGEYEYVPPSLAKRVARAISTAASKEENWQLILNLGAATEHQAGPIKESLQRGFTETYASFASFIMGYGWENRSVEIVIANWPHRGSQMAPYRHHFESIFKT